MFGRDTWNLSHNKKQKKKNKLRPGVCQIVKKKPKMTKS